LIKSLRRSPHEQEIYCASERGGTCAAHRVGE